MSTNFKKSISILVMLLTLVRVTTAQLFVSSNAIPPVNPLLNQMFSQVGGGVRATVMYPMADSTLINSKNPTVRVFGTLQRISPSFFKISLKSDSTLGASFSLFPSGSHGLSKLELEHAFGNFDDANLVFEGISPAELNGKLPAGNYTICFTAEAKKYPAVCCPNGCDDASNINCDEPVIYQSSPGCSSFSIVDCTQPTNGIIVNTTATPINPVIKQAITNGAVHSTLQFTNPPGCTVQMKLFGKIERTSPSPFTIELNPDFQQQPPVIVMAGATVLSTNQILSAFSNFNENDLVVTGIDLASIKDASDNIKLPDGNYRVCLYGRYFQGDTLGANASNPNLGCGNFTISCSPTNGASMNTIVTPAPNPLIAQAIQSGQVTSSIQFSGATICNATVKLSGKIERLSPSPFTIETSPNYQSQPLSLVNGVSQMSPSRLLDALGNLSEANLVTQGIDLSSIKDANGNIKLPDGNYRICFSAKYLSGGNASDPNLGCASFSLCNQAGGAPQFTQPVSSLTINSQISYLQAVTPVIFTWTPPQFNCGIATGLTYDFEIRELFNNQTVSDAIDNPFVFRKTQLPSTTFLLDTNLNRGVLQEGKKYIIRVRAVSTNVNSHIEFENNGYSRIEAFQYGGNLITEATPDPQDYYIPFKERQTDLLDKIRRAGRDSIVPVEEYIAFALTQNNIAYNSDAIELLLALNPELANVKKVKLSYTPTLPVFPDVSATDQNNFNKEHRLSLEPDQIGENKFLKYLDTLNSYKQKITGNTGTLVSDIASYLTSVKTQIDSVDKVSVNFINQVLSELLYELRLSSKGLSKSQYSRLQSLASTLQELTAASPNSTSFFYRLPEKRTSSLSSLAGTKLNYDLSKVPLFNASLNVKGMNGPEHLLAAIAKQLLPFDIVVWRSSKVAPNKPILDAPDLTATFRIFYTLSNLYNHRNPEVNAISTTRLASTVQVSIPANPIFKFWTLNMRNHKMTKAEDVELKDVLIHTSKILPGAKKPTIVLKVE